MKSLAINVAYPKQILNPKPKQFPLIDLSNAPTVDKKTAGLFWAYFILRHSIGPKHGYYGPEKWLPFLKKLENKMLEESKPTGELPVRAVPRVKAEDLSPEDFQHIYLESNTPVVIEGLAKNWKSKEWSPAYFKQRYGDFTIPVRMRGDKMDESALKISDMPLKKLVENMDEGGPYFGANLADIFNNNPELREALDIPLLTKYMVSAKHSKIGSTQLFMSGEGTRSGFHCTGGINLFVMVHGHKEWTFVPPAYSKWMYPITRRDMFYSASPVEWRKSFKEIETEGHPLYKYAPKFKADIYAGDVLFSPQWWWHAVYTDCPSIGVAVRAMNKFVFGNKVYSWMWITSPQFRELIFEIVKNGWGSDAKSGARLAFEQEFVDRSTH